MNKQHVKFDEGIDKKSTIFNLMIDPVIKGSNVIARVVYDSGICSWFQLTNQQNHTFVFGPSKIVLTNQFGVQRFFTISDNMAQLFGIPQEYFSDASEIDVFQMTPYDIFTIDDVLGPLAQDIFGFCETTFVGSLDTETLVGILNFGIGNVVIKIDLQNGFIDIDKSDSIKENDSPEMEIDCDAFFNDANATISDFWNLFTAINERFQLPNEI